MGTDTAGFFFKPSMISGALSPYILWMALRCTTSEEPPSMLSRRNLACSSADIRDNLRCTVSSTLMVAKLVSRTKSNCIENKNRYHCENLIISFRDRRTRKSGIQPVKWPRTCHSPQSVHLHSGRCAPRTEFSWNWQMWSPQTKRGKRPRCRSGPECDGIKLKFKTEAE